MATPSHKNPCPWGPEIHNFCKPFLGHHYHMRSLSDLCLGREKNIFLRNNAFSLYDLIFDHILAQEPLPGGHEIYIKFW